MDWRGTEGLDYRRVDSLVLGTALGGAVQPELLVDVLCIMKDIHYTHPLDGFSQIKHRRSSSNMVDRVCLHGGLVGRV